VRDTGTYADKDVVAPDRGHRGRRVPGNAVPPEMEGDSMAELPIDVVLGYIEDLTDGKSAEAFDRVDPEGTFWIAGRDWSSGGTYGRDDIAKVLGETVGSLLAAPLEVRIVGITAGGERVAVELEVGGPTKDGRNYDNRMHILFVVRDGKIVESKEYHDTLHASLVIGP
jgi:ketosteroid isomerase-like protein